MSIDSVQNQCVSVVLRKVIIDATDEDDVFASADAPFDNTMNPALRSSHLALTFRIGNIDLNKYFFPLCIIAKDKSDAFIPAVKVVRERKIGVAPEPHFSENRLDPADFQNRLASLCSYEIPSSP